jgi:hypothetical protein
MPCNTVPKGIHLLVDAGFRPKRTKGTSPEVPFGNWLPAHP